MQNADIMDWKGFNMSSIVPLSLNRTSVALQKNRAYNSLTNAQQLMARYEHQLQTQRQYQYGSDSPYNASTSLSVQTQVERKNQNAANINATQTFLSATDTTLSMFNAMTDDARAMALEAINTTTSDTQRAALAQSVKQTLQQAFNFGNYSFENRYVFAGSTTSVLPFEWGADSYSVNYKGVESNLFSWSDTDLLSQTNVNGVDVFGAVSDPVRGKTDLNPAVRDTTLLSNLNGGNGVDKGSIRFNYTLNGRAMTFDVDLSKCVTLGDVERTIENTKNPYYSLKVDLTENGLAFSLPPGTPGSLIVSEIGKGTVARQLGIPVNTEFNADKPLAGRDVNPALTQTTSLDDILGSRAAATLVFAGSNNDILLRANNNGENFVDPKTGKEWDINGVNVNFRSDPLITPGSETVEYNSDTKTILINIHPDKTSANNIIEAMNDASAAGTIPPFTASASNADQQRSGLAGTGIVTLLPGITIDVGTTSGGAGFDFDKSGIQLVNGNATFDISFENCKTIGDVLSELNDPLYGLYAEVNESQNGIDIRSRISGADFCIGELGGKTAAQLGVRTSDLDTQLSALDFGRGVTDYTGPGTPATAIHENVTPNSSLILTARNEGKAWNDYTLNFVPTTDPQGKAVVSMDEENKVINIGINPGVTTACEVVQAFNEQPGPKQFFDLTLYVPAGGTNTGEGVVYDGFDKTSGGIDGGIDFTITRNDGTVLEIDIHGAKTLGDVLNIINNHPDNRDGQLKALLSEFGNGIELTDKSFGKQVTRVDRTLLSTAAIELGLVNMGEEYRTKTTIGEQANTSINTATLDGSLLVTAKSVGTYANEVKIEFIQGMPPDFQYDAAAKTLRFSMIPGVTTANDIVDLFQTKASDTVRSMFDFQNGVNSDGLPSSGAGLAALETVTMTGGIDSELKGNDPNPQETNSLFNALIRMQVAMEKNDTREIERSTQLLDVAVHRLDSSRSTLGVMLNSLDNVQTRLSAEAVQYQETLNSTLRVDFADASLGYMAQQLSYQATMQISSAMFQLSLLNYL